jgi:uncharacterized protein YyaL (SSP411 family)
MWMRKSIPSFPNFILMPNRLQYSTSPYLLQHAHNPVDWHEWNEEALAKAVEQDKPILVSIGYSSCHWCHVMERECFENEAIARIMNEHFVCIKVDREERPDVDAIYMEAVQAMRQSGGWPLNVFLTPDQKPFFGGTYFPPAQWQQLLMQIHKVFHEKRSEINESAEELKKLLQSSDVQRLTRSGPEIKLNREALDEMFSIIAKRFDSEWGGIDKAPKFIMPATWQALLRYYRATQNAEALRMVTLTLEQIANGGICDHLGGGFARYSVDARWFAPHFEKMLYDNAQLISLYADAYTLTKNPRFKFVVYETVVWLEREMMHPAGGFYSALDADSEGVEGKFYTWTEAEINEVLREEAAAAIRFYNITPDGNWEHGRNILFRTAGNQPEPDNLKGLKQKLLAHRNRRVRPGLDDKIITGWNAMTIQGLVDSYKAFADERFLSLALNAISFIEAFLTEDEKLYRTFKNRHSQTEGFLEDYAFIIQAYASLYEVTFNEGWLFKAKTHCEYVLNHFFDATEGYFHFSASTAEQLIARKKEIFDNVIPSGNSVMARNLFRLGTLLDKEDWKNLSGQMVEKLKSLILSEPVYMANWGIALMNIYPGIYEVVISGEEALTYRMELHRHFLPDIVTVGTTRSGTLPLLEGRDAKQGITMIYVCKNKVCSLPVNNTADALTQLTP